MFLDSLRSICFPGSKFCISQQCFHWWANGENKMFAQQYFTFCPGSNTSNSFQSRKVFQNRWWYRTLTSIFLSFFTVCGVGCLPAVLTKLLLENENSVINFAHIIVTPTVTPYPTPMSAPCTASAQRLVWHKAERSNMAAKVTKQVVHVLSCFKQLVPMLADACPSATFVEISKAG